ncbi:uncharacterized protein FTJAE_11952 [Fusarium tjaetaba]|uniref:Uncharacterized protein n=1 Tax=Fusarium tjaetaba TaxID=1567544 RepID=A0A8H5QR68_9HYPO|nr:uncharacterized protein FTJAE_11952 [Fusarium tjaetaba]KAF5619364.1 hypothetical protein FTJAE_11952 [Fusarium tjaetaba]
MFRPKQPFEGKEEIEARLTATNDDGLTVISSQCISFAKEQPDNFMNYLRHAWKQDGPIFREDKDLLNALQLVEVTRPEGEAARLVSLYLPFPKLVYLRNRYLLPHESFRLLLSEYEITAGADLESWTALAVDIDLVREDDAMFYIDLLAAVKSQNNNGAVEFPRRVLELYLRIQAACEMKGEEAMQKWTSSLDAVLKELDKKPDFQYSKQLYDVLGKIWGNLPTSDLERLRVYLKTNQCIILSENDTKRFSLAECVWAPKLNAPGTYLINSQSFDIGCIFDELVNITSLEPKFGHPKADTARILLVALSRDIEKYGRYLDKEKLLKNDIFPVTGHDWDSKLCSASAEFYIMDNANLNTTLRNKVPVLDIDYTTFWLLQPFFVWAGLESRYLKNHLTIHTAYDPGSVTPPYIHSLRAKALLRLAVHYKSPQTLTAFGRNFLARTLGRTRIHYLGDNTMTTTLRIKSIEDSRVIASYPDIVILKDDDGLDIYLEKSSAEVVRAVQLPVRLAKILMEDTNDKSKTSIKMILDEEGIVDVDKPQSSSYIPENEHGRLSRLLFDRKPDRPSGNDLSRPDQKPKTTGGKEENNDLSQQLSSLSLQGKQDDTDTSWSSDSTKKTLV